MLFSQGRGVTNRHTDSPFMVPPPACYELSVALDKFSMQEMPLELFNDDALPP